ncbi:MAG: DUF4297 family anti-phage-associated protein [Rikenellaceae bacterium]
MTKNRSANSTIKGYFYQFDHFILQLLNCDNDNDIITVEGVEDVDIKAASEIKLIQCKYFERTEYNHSVIGEALRHLYNHFATSVNKCNYTLYGYYSKGQEKLSIPISRTDFKANFMSLKAFEGATLDDVTIDDFLSHLTVNNRALKYEDQEIQIINKIRSICECSEYVAENHFYNNALRIIKDISVEPDISNRSISKGDFLNKIRTQDVLFNHWFMEKKSLDQYCRMVKKEFFSPTNLSPTERFILIDVDSNITVTDIKTLICNIAKKLSRLSKREATPFCPYIYLNNISDTKVSNILNLIVKDDIVFIDGYDYKDAIFSAKSIVKVANYQNEIKFKIVYNTERLIDIFNANSKTKEIYQFYLTKYYYTNAEHKHEKILISRTEDINKII